MKEIQNRVMSPRALELGRENDTWPEAFHSGSIFFPSDNTEFRKKKLRHAPPSSLSVQDPGYQ